MKKKKPTRREPQAEPEPDAEPDVGSERLARSKGANRKMGTRGRQLLQGNRRGVLILIQFESLKVNC